MANFDDHLGKYSALVVDDEQQICDMCEMFLQSTGWFHSIIKSYDVTTALQKIANQDFDLIITDNKMPKKDGLDFIRLVRSSEHRKQPQIILMSSYLKERHINIAVSSGVKNIIVKPFDKDQMLNMVMKVLKITSSD